MSKRDEMVDIARSQLGYWEGPNNDTKYGEWYGLNYNPWCAMFCSWCSAQIGMDNIAFPRFAGCTTGFHEMQGWGITTNEHIVPEPGDLIFFEWDGDYDDYDHVGIVESADENYVNTIEGNHEDCVARYTYSRWSNCIVGYAKPRYGDAPTPPTPPPPVTNEIRDFQHWLNQHPNVVIDEDGIFGQWTKKACVIVLQEQLNADYGLSIAVDGIWGNETWDACHHVCLTQGDVRDMVKLVQGLLVCYGYDTNGIDGIFGDGTYNAVVSYQRNHGLTADGMVGISTLSLMFS